MNSARSDEAIPVIASVAKQSREKAWDNQHTFAPALWFPILSLWIASRSLAMTPLVTKPMEVIE